MVGTVYQLKVTLRGVRPPIWRRVRVPGTVTLGELHDVLQIALRWSNSHLHQFRIGRQYFGLPDPESFGQSTIDEQRVQLEQVAGAKSKLIYEYDFGDGWEHDVLVERVDSADIDELPVCTDGRRAIPPEDCGGPYGYTNLVEILAHPKHAEYAEMRDLVGRYWRPEAFNLDLVNEQLADLGAHWRRSAAKPRRTRSRAKAQSLVRQSKRAD